MQIKSVCFQGDLQFEGHVLKALALLVPSVFSMATVTPWASAASSLSLGSCDSTAKEIQFMF